MRRLQRSLSTTLITESNEIYTIILSPHMYPTFIFFYDKWRKSNEHSPIDECPLYFRQYTPGLLPLAKFGNPTPSTTLEPIKTLKSNDFESLSSPSEDRFFGTISWSSDQSI